LPVTLALALSRCIAKRGACGLFLHFNLAGRPFFGVRSIPSELLPTISRSLLPFLSASLAECFTLSGSIQFVFSPTNHRIMIAFTLLPLLLPALVSAHGYVGQVTIDGTVYKGNAVGTIPTIDSVIRQVYTQFPVKNASNPDLHCGMGAQFAKDVASANPGSKLEVLWVGGPNGSINVSNFRSGQFRREVLIVCTLCTRLVAPQHWSDYALHGQVRWVLRFIQLYQC
jgi:hypothetical protein